MEDEARLVERAKRDPRAFAALYDRYVERIYAYAQRETKDTAAAQDVASATFEKALTNLPRYRWQGTSFGAWLYAIARNEIRMHYRRQKWTVPLLGRFFGGDNHVERAVQQHEAQDAVQAALNRLPQRDQEVLRLRYYEELSNPEIGEVLNCSSRNAAVRIHRALKRLRKQLAQTTPEAQEVMVDVQA